MQALDPLTIEDIGFGSSWSMFGLVGIDEVDLEAATFEEFEGGDPVDASGLHGDGVDAGQLEPVGQHLEVCGAGAEGAYPGR